MPDLCDLQCNAPLASGDGPPTPSTCVSLLGEDHPGLPSPASPQQAAAGLSGGEETSTAMGGALEQHRSECDGKLQKSYYLLFILFIGSWLCMKIMTVVG